MAWRGDDACENRPGFAFHREFPGGCRGECSVGLGGGLGNQDFSARHAVAKTFFEVDAVAGDILGLDQVAAQQAFDDGAGVHADPGREAITRE